MKQNFKRDETKTYFELTKLESSKDERRGVKSGRMKVKRRMGKKWKE